MNVGLFRVDGAKSTPVGEPIRTDHDGAYQFPHLPTGDYRVEVTAVDSAWRFSPDNTGDDAADSDVSGGPPAESGRRVASSAIVSVDGQVTVVDAGLFKPAPASPDVSPSPSAPGTPAVDPSGSPAVAGVRASGGGRLPVTGSGITTMVGVGAALLVAGMALALAARRRTRHRVLS